MKTWVTESSVSKSLTHSADTEVLQANTEPSRERVGEDSSRAAVRILGQVGLNTSQRP